jgi:Zn-dependent metalloprotease
VGGDGPRVLVVSPTFQQAAGPEAFRERLRAVSAAIERLRMETTSGWIGRQDDVTGYLAELTGGRYSAPGAADAPSVASFFFQAYGQELFGVPATEVAFTEESSTEDTIGLRGTQQVGGVPVLDGGVTATVSTSLAVTSLRGRVFPGVAVAIEPVLTANQAGVAAVQAAEAAVAATQGAPDATAEGQPRLVIVPVGDRGVLCWEVRVSGDGTAGAIQTSLYYVDAVRGEVIAARPVAIALRMSVPGSTSPSGGPLPQTPVQGQSVAVSGTSPNGQPLQASGVQGPDGSISLVDTTTGGYDPATGSGAIQTHDATGLDRDQLPGPLVTSSSTTIADSEALAAQAFSRYIYDYYRDVHGRNSWDGAGGSSVSSVHFGPPEFCNAFFNGEQMVYGGQCVLDGEPQSLTELDIDIAGHEMTHGVTASSSRLNYTGQSGALNESFSDYFGNVIGDRFHGRDSVAAFEDSCAGFQTETRFCHLNPDGSWSLRYLANGTKMSDYLYLLDPPPTFKALFEITNDNGGVHLNSAIWNNALWSIRMRLAQIDGMAATASPRAQAFDGIVYAALTRHLTASSGFLEAAAAVVQAAREAGADPVTLREIGRIFRANEICSGCASVPQSPAQPVMTSAATQRNPQVSGDTVAWVDLQAPGGRFGQAGQSTVGGKPIALNAEADVSLVAFAGPTVVWTTLPGRVIRFDPATGVQQVLQENNPAAPIALAGSEEGAAWIAGDPDTQQLSIEFVDPSGERTTLLFPTEETGLPVSLGVGGGTVAAGTDQGEIIVWRQGAGPTVIAEGLDPVLAVDAYVDRVLAVTLDLTQGSEDRRRHATLYDLASGQSTLLSQSAAPWGATMSQEYAVWAERKGALGGRISERLQEQGATYVDTDLYLYSFATGRTYDVLPIRGQQGFPALSGNRLVWQDTVNGGDDIYTGVLPSGL